MTAEDVSETFDLYSPAFAADPHAMYTAMRERAPAHLAHYPGGLDLWLVTRYEDVRTVLSDHRFSMSSENSASPLFADDPEEHGTRGLEHNLTNLDPPDHTRLRRLVTREFSAARVEALRSRVAAHVDALIDAFAGDGTADLVAQFAVPLPTGVAAQLLGVEPEDWERFRVFSRRLVMPDYDMTPEDFTRNKQHIRAFIGELIDRKRARPGNDLAGSLTRACDAEGAITEDELVGTLFTLLVGSHETTTNFIGNAVLALLRHPDQLELLRTSPELLPAAVEELLRYDGPFEASSLRFAVEDVEMGGVTVPAGSTVVAVLASANRDPERFFDPDRLEIRRPDNAHVAFGHGIHFCPGRSLSLLEAEVALERLISRLPGLRHAGGAPLRWHEGLFFRGLHELPVAFEPEPAPRTPPSSPAPAGR
ncbi:cytochrome P450 family protein [Streptomyces sp. NPDC001889]